MPRRWRTALWICAALSRTCVWASASPCDTSPARATQSACRASSSAAAASACSNSGSSGCGDVSAASRRPTSACANAATREGSGASGQRSSCSPTASSAAAMRVVSGSVEGSAATCVCSARKLPALHLQSQPQRVPPADIGAAVGVVADPARQDHRTGIEFRPAIRPGTARNSQQRRIEMVDRIAAVRDGCDSLRELVGQRDRRRTMRSRSRSRTARLPSPPTPVQPKPESRMSDVL